MRTISDLVKAIARLLRERTTWTTTCLRTKSRTRRWTAGSAGWTAMAEEGDQRAENLLFEEVDPADKKYLEMSLAFYMYLNEFDDDFLYTNNYSREENRGRNQRHQRGSSNHRI